jgi:hypothetical protein
MVIDENIVRTFNKRSNIRNGINLEVLSFNLPIRSVNPGCEPTPPQDAIHAEDVVADGIP